MGESGGYQVVVEQLLSHTAVVGTSRPSMVVKVHPSLLSGCGVEVGQVHYPDQRLYDV